MAISGRILYVLCLSLLSFHGSLAASSVCPRSDLDSFMGGIRSQCPLWIERSQPDELTGDQLDRDLGNIQGDGHRSIFFYASWCPFSRKARPVFDALCSMFPQIRHVAVEQSSAMPSLFSRYGIHSFPSIVIATGTTRTHYHGLKDLDSLVNFYKEKTGLEPVAYFSVEQPPNTSTKTPEVPLNPLDQPLAELITSEPYLASSLLFILLKASIPVFPVLVSRLKAFAAVHGLHLNLGFFGYWSHLLERVVHIIDLKNLRIKFHLSNKVQNFRKGAKSARRILFFKDS